MTGTAYSRIWTVLPKFFFFKSQFTTEVKAAAVNQRDTSHVSETTAGNFRAGQDIVFFSVSVFDDSGTAAQKIHIISRNFLRQQQQL